MKMQQLLEKIIGVVRISGGVSVDLKSMKILSPQDYWMFPKYPSKTKILPNDIDLNKETSVFIVENNGELHESDCFLGIWLNSKTKEYYFDITTTNPDKDQAITTARKISKKEGRNIVAIYNPKRDETMFL